MPSTVLTGKGCIVDVTTGLVYGGVQEFKLTNELETKSFPAGERWSSYTVPVGVNWRGEIAFKALDAATLGVVLGGQSSTGRVLEVLDEEAVVPEEGPRTVTLEHDDNVALSETVKDAAGRSFQRVEDDPASGEYAIDGDTLTFSAADAGAEVRLSYLRLDPNAGDRLVVGPEDIPKKFSLYGVLRGHDLIEGRAPEARFAVYLADCCRTGEFRFGAPADGLGGFTLSFTAHNDQPGDVVFYLPPRETA
ncbi:MAG TPA: hypothetical protein VM054_06505 [bacterium]|nr:hypothetical protein [bacterium]